MLSLDFFGAGAIEKPVAENGGGGRHRIRVSSWSVGEDRRGANLHLTASLWYEMSDLMDKTTGYRRQCHLPIP